MQNNALQNIVQHAYNTVPYYKQTFDEYQIDPFSIKQLCDLEKLPILTKEKIQEDPDKFISEKYKYFPYSQDLIINRTSGSTGKFLKVFWSKNDEIRSMFSLWMLRSKVYGIDASSKFCSFHTTVYNANRLVETPDSMLLSSDRNLSFSKLNMDYYKLGEYYKQILDFKPEWLFVQPSIAYLLADYIEQNNLYIPDSLKYIELTGEYLFSNYHEKIRKIFQVKTANMYGSNETNGIAIECSEGHLHCLNNNVIVEILKDGKRVEDGEEGEIYVTSLTNTVMPFIRYALGDRGIMYTNELCSCGRRSPIIKLISGRVGEYLQLDNGELLNCYIFLYPIERINSHMGNPINQFQVEQNTLNKITVNLVIKKSFNNWKDSICAEFKNYISKIGISNVECEFKFFDSILPDNSTGKLQFFLNKIAK
jgi:phenylacetate-CoA ligase